MWLEQREEQRAGRGPCTVWWGNRAWSLPCRAVVGPGETLVCSGDGVGGPPFPEPLPCPELSLAPLSPASSPWTFQGAAHSPLTLTASRAGPSSSQPRGPGLRSCRDEATTVPVPPAVAGPCRCPRGSRCLLPTLELALTGPSALRRSVSEPSLRPVSSHCNASLPPATCPGLSVPILTLGLPVEPA